VLPLLSPGDPFREELETDVKRAVAEHAKLDLKLPLVEDHQLGKVGLLPGTNFLLRQIALENARAVGVPIDSQVIHDAQRELVSTVDIKRAALRKGYREGTEFHLLAAALRSSSTAARAAAEQCRPAGAKQASLHHISRAKLETVVAANLVEFLLEQKECAVRLSKSLPRNPDLFEKSALSDGGEHFLAYAHISEALLILGDQAGYVAWQRRLRDCFERMQNSDGSWMGRNCITDPVYSTASSIYALTAERDEPLLLLQ
jgi:hypothetical protein